MYSRYKLHTVNHDFEAIQSAFLNQVVKVWDIFTGRAMFEFKTEDNSGRSSQAAVDGISAIEIDKSGKRFKLC